MRNLNIFNTRDTEQVRENLLSFLKAEEKSGFVEITRNDEITERWGVEGAVLIGRISKGKRCNFQLFYNGFMLQGKEISLSHNILNIDKQSVFLNEFDLKELDHITIEVAY